MSDARVKPPVLSAWVMRRSVLPQDAEAVMGDLHEEFNAIAASSGVAAARRWYRRQVRASIGYNVRQRVAWTRTAGTVQDVRHAVRSLRATPTFTAVALVVLTLGIGATTAIFSVVDGVALRGLPYAQGDRLVKLTEPPTTRRGFQGGSVPAADIVDWRAQQSTFEDLAAIQISPQAFVMRDGDGVRELRAMMVSASLFPMLRARPQLGRAFTSGDEIRGHEHVAILSDGFWRRRFGADPGVVGRTVDVEGGRWLIVGVMPPGFTYPPVAARPADLWIPYVPVASELSRGNGTHRSSHAEVVGRLKDGVSIDQARADIERVTAALRRDNPVWFRDRAVALTSLQDAIVGPVKSWMLMLLGAVAFVLLIACVNVANLLLARATSRSRDVAVRAALGASRWRILRGLLAESLVLSVTGTALGVLVAMWGVHVLRASLPPSLPRLDQIAINYRVLTAAACAAVAVAIAVTPVWQWSPSTLTASLREAGRTGSAGAARQRARLVLLVAEVALAVVLLVASGLFISSFVKLVRVDLGFELGHVMSVDLSPRGRAKSSDGAFLPAVAATLQGIFEQVRRIPGIERAALVEGSPPLDTGSDRTSVIVPGKPVFGSDESADDKHVSTEYFKVFGVPLLAGRFFDDADAAPGAPPVVLVNDVAARVYFDGANPVGATVQIGQAKNASFTVVGVVRSVRLHGPESEPRPEIYRPLEWHQSLGSPVVTLVVRTSRDHGDVAGAIRSAIQSAAPDLALPDAEAYDTLFDRIIAQRKFNTWVLVLFGVLAIAIAGAGIYGVMAYIVEQRTQEIGVRIALGAEPAAVIRMVLSQASACIAAGLAVGLAAGWALSRSVQAFLFKIDAHDPRVYAGAAAVLVAAGLLAAAIPARRAARVDPMIALRAQ